MMVAERRNAQLCFLSVSQASEIAAMAGEKK